LYVREKWEKGRLEKEKPTAEQSLKPLKVRSLLER
jgi:hypothetical protein